MTCGMEASPGQEPAVPSSTGRAIPTALDTAKNYTARGWRVIPLLHRDKNPANSVGSGWPNLRLEEADLPKHFNGRPQNVGVLLGEPSGGLVDVDLDHEAAVYFAERFLPPTGAIFGRDGKRRSHWLYRVSDPPNVKRWHDKALGTVVELRGTGGQTVFPGSTHPDGDPITWDEEGEPAHADADELRECCQRLHDFVVYSVKVTNYALTALELACEQVRTAPAPTGKAGGNRNNELFQQAIGMGQLVAAGALSQEQAEKQLLAAAEAAGLKDQESRSTLAQGLMRGLKEPRDLSHVAVRPDFMAPVPTPVATGNLTWSQRYQQGVEKHSSAIGSGFGNEDGHKLNLGQEPDAPQFAPRSAAELLEQHTTLRPAVVDGLLRQGETANIVSAPKIGKSHLTLELAFSVVTGTPFVGKFACPQGRVLLIDNELHPQTLASRIRRLLVGRQLDVSAIEGLDVECLRGRLRDLHVMRSYFAGIDPGRYSLIIIDALYRFLPKGTDENSNADICALYNEIDAHADRIGCAFTLVHHTSKGSQTNKTVTDVGSGAGSQSRAVDTHLVLRHHEEKGAVVVDAALRSWPPLEPFCMRWDFPQWRIDDELDPNALKPERPKKVRKTAAEGDEPASALKAIGWDTDRFVREFLSDTPRLLTELMETAAKADGLSRRRAEQLLKAAVDMEKAHRWTYGRNRAQLIATVPQPELEGVAAHGEMARDCEDSEAREGK